MDIKRNAFVFFLFLSLSSTGQKFITENSKVVFFSGAAIEDITAENAKAMSIFDTGSGDIAFSIPIREFKFAKSLMQEHFNEKYMDTEKFPKSTFQGKITGYVSSTSGTQVVRAQGKLTIHGITKDVDIPGTVEFVANKIMLKSNFMVKLDDYSVSRPKLLWQNIAEEVKVSIDFTFKPYEK